MIIPLPANIYWVPTLKEALVSMLEIHLWIGMGKEKTYRQTKKTYLDEVYVTGRGNRQKIIIISKQIT